MYLYRIQTEDINRDAIERAFSRYFDGFTILAGSGYWRGTKENCLVIEVLAEAKDCDTVLGIAEWIRGFNEQESVAVTWQQVEIQMVGAEL